MKRLDIASSENIKPFQEDTLKEHGSFTYIGTGEFGGKAYGLAVVKERLNEFCSQQRESPICIDIPSLTVITTSYFDSFMEDNQLYDIVFTETWDEELIECFGEARLPFGLEEKLTLLLQHYRVPLAVRPSSLLEDSLISPFAGVYKTRMIPNNSVDPQVNLDQLIKAIKYVYSSAFLNEARMYLKSGCHNLREEKMAIIIQEVIGDTYNDRYYPNISGIASSYNFYPAGHAHPADGVVHLALGLGKAIIDGGAVWSYSPRYPEVNPPFNSMNQMLEQTQLDFWVIDLSLQPHSKDILEEPYLKRLSLTDAEGDNTLGYIASTYDYDSDRIDIGIGFKGPRVLDFAPLLKVDLIPTNQLIQSLLEFCQEVFQDKVEIQFAITFDLSRKSDHLARFGLLQVRSLGKCGQLVELEENQWKRYNVLATSNKVMGNGCVSCIKDILYVDPDNFNLKDTQAIANELAQMNLDMVETESPYLLIGYGRWGTTDPWLGIPVDWEQISGARVIIESQLSGVNTDLSQGLHFFHHLCKLKILYFSQKKNDPFPVDFDWLKQQNIINRGEYIRHVRLQTPLYIKVDGRKRKGVIYK
jgi:Pyruvate phosphate dikinase, AMP/ATP-binding domain